MKTTIIPVSPLSYKVITREEGAEPFRPRPHSIIGMACDLSRAPRDSVNIVNSTLTSQIDIIPPAKRAARIHRNAQHIGLFLHRAHIERWMEWTLGLYDSGMEAKEALMKFAQFYGITEDDYSLESIYRKWVRYIKSLRDRGCIDEEAPRIHAVIKPMPDRQLRSMMERVVHNNAGIFITSSESKIDESLLRALDLYISKYYGGYEVGELADRYGITRHSVYRKIRSVRQLIESNQIIL